MNDHAAPKVKYDIGVPLDTINSVPLNQGGVAIESMNGGVLLNKPQDQGIPWTAPPPKKKVKIEVCETPTKSGAPCKAKPVKGMAQCIGHSRVKTDGQSGHTE